MGSTGIEPISRLVVVDAWNLAFNRTNPAEGGCPAVSPPVDCQDAHKTKAACDADAACAWCTSGAVPSVCETLRDAKKVMS